MKLHDKSFWRWHCYVSLLGYSKALKIILINVYFFKGNIAKETDLLICVNILLEITEMQELLIKELAKAGECGVEDGTKLRS